jgi:hypothetical protein
MFSVGLMLVGAGIAGVGDFHFDLVVGLYKLNPVYP